MRQRCSDSSVCMRFLVDENLPRDIAAILNDMGHDAIAVVGSSLEGSEDSFLWSLNAREGRIFITEDLDFPLNISPKPPGLVLVRFPDAFYVDTLINMTVEFLGRSSEEELMGQITVLAPGQTRVREL
jgi:predicted nuclease of predicted toxin-antitoxin system